MLPLAAEMDHVGRHVRACVDCGNLDMQDKCSLCMDTRRDHSRLCVVEDVSDLWAMERAGIFAGLYHVLGGTLSALDGRGPAELGIDRLVARARALRAPEDKQPEVILATSATVDGQTTAHYIADQLGNVRVSTLAQGVPIGGELDYLDDGTITAALRARKTL